MEQKFYIPKKLFLLVCCICWSICSYAVIRYVKTGSAGTAPYTSWATASNDLQAVINQCAAGDEIWIATGTYKPNRRADALTVITTTDRNDAFVLKNAVKIYGGFTGVETLLSQRNSTTNVATLSGDIGTAGVITDNCYHVVIIANTASTTTLMDGVSIISGNANAVALTPSITVNTFTINPRYGGGMYKVSSAADITDCKFKRNDASLSGGGIYETLSSSVSVFDNCTIQQNTSADDGGGMYIVTSGSQFQSCIFTVNDAADKGAGMYISGSGSPAFTDCTISSNDAVGEGGAAYFTGSGSPTFTGCTVNSNTAGSNGGGIASYVSGTFSAVSVTLSANTSANAGGAVYNNNSPSTLTNCLISGNLAASGGGISNATSDVTIINCTIAGNRATGFGGGIGFSSSNPIIENSIVYGNTAVPAGTNAFYNSGSTLYVIFSLIEGGYSGTGNVNANPLFVNQILAASAPTATGNYQLQKCSPALNGGGNSYIPSGITTDIVGAARINYGTVEMGAYEMQLQFAVPSASGIVFVDNTKTGNGNSWANAVTELADALVAAKYDNSITQIWVAKGTYYPKYNAYDNKSLACDNTNRANSFVLVDGVKVHGGFAGGETDTLQSNPTANPTILSGDIGVANDVTDNCGHVVIATDLSSASINSFTITKGYAAGVSAPSIVANGKSMNPFSGAGLCQIDAVLYIKSCNFLDNTANLYGGGIHVGMNSTGSSITVINTSFNNNKIVTDGISAGTIGFGAAIGTTNPAPNPINVGLNNCTFNNNNYATNVSRIILGGAIYLGYTKGVIDISSSSFTGNSTGNFTVGTGGAIFMQGGSSTPEGNIKNCEFKNNYGGTGGALKIIGYPGKITNCVFNENSANTEGGALNAESCSLQIANSIFSGNSMSGSFNGGSALRFLDDASLISNCLVSGNYSNYSGSAIDILSSATEFFGTTVVANKALTNTTGAGMWVSSATPKITNSIFWRNDGATPGISQIYTSAGTVNASYSTIEGGYPGTGNISTNPLFISPQLASAAPTTAGDYHLQKCSPAINVGSNALIPAGITKDLDSNNRIAFGIVDMGAYEKHLVKPDANGIVYVDSSNIIGAVDGSNWTKAVTELADALKEAKTNTDVKEIWTAKGTYKPIYNASDTYLNSICNTTDRDAAFVLVADVKVYGGFASGETDTSGRNFVTNETIMSGDIGIVIDTSDNCYHVAISAGAVGSAVLDGFGILNGISSISYLTSPLVNTKSINYSYGGGIYMNESSPVIKNCSVRNNYAYNDGGGMYLYHSTPVIANCNIAGNLANKGGGVALYDLSPALFSNCTITGNKAYIASNIQGKWGGGVYINYADPTFSNCTITGNFGGVGNDIFTYGAPIIKNSIIQWLSSVPVNGSNVTYSYVYGGHPGTGNISTDPLFVNPIVGTIGNTPNTLGDYHLQACSPAINMGDNVAVISLTDFDKNTRIKYTTVDMGAYEVQTIDLANSTWKGVNTNWNDKINWCGGYIPYDTTNVIIPSSLTNYPTIGSGFINGVKNILLSSGSSVGIINTGSLSIYGTYTNNGSTINNKGKWVMAGSAVSQSFPGISATVSAMKDLEINNASGITFNKSFSITGSLIPTNGAIDVNNVVVTLKSSDTATASVDIIQPTASISYTGTGAFIVERFINTGTNAGAGQHIKSWQFLATPTTGQTINQSWQENGTAPAGFGTWITGTGTGFDATTANPSLKYFNQAGINWTAVTNTGTSLVNKLGYMLFVRGDRTVTTYNGTPNNTIMRSKGQLFSPTNAAPSVAVTANKFQSFGNPYASRIEFSKVLLASTGINDVFYVWDPKLAGTYNLGGYQTITGIAGYVPTVGTPPTGNAATAYYPAGVAAPYIESGQAVFVKGNGTGGNVNFNENIKATGSRLVNRPVGNHDIVHRQFLFTTLFTNTGEIADGNIVAFERGFGNNINEHDAVKLMNSGENFGLTRNDIILAVEAREKVVANDTIFYSMSNLRQQGYQLRFAPVNMHSLGLQPFLVDKFRNTKTLLSVTDSSYVDFMVTADIASAAASRFFIVFKKINKLPAADTENKYSKPVKGMIGDKEQLISVYPNPVVNQEINIDMKELPVGQYQYGLYNSNGQLMASGVFDHTKGSASTLIKPAVDLAHGIYQLKLLHDTTQVAVVTVNLQ